jgi:carbon monoxide dehydrogenase subunit G
VKLDHRITVDAPRKDVWALVMDLQRAARCVPGTRDLAPDGDGVRGTLDVRLGPVKLALAGTVRAESHDEAAGTARLRAEASDQRLGGAVRALVDLSMTGDSPVELRIRTDLAILGRIGELGQPLIARQADKVLAGFAECLRASVAAIRET